MYVCGITPYDATHLGHAATYVTFDIIGRALRDNGIDVRYVENVTDVDEPLLERAERDGLAWQDLATAEIALFREDMTALGVLPPDELVGVVESIDLIAAAVRRLVDAGVTYEVSDDTASGADIYLDLAAASAFGEVSGWSRAEMDAVIRERGGDPDRPGKRDPLDPLLWRAARVDEPSWSPEGLTPGRPGWHIECTAIAGAKLGLPIDIQGGGSDLVFPHHEMSAAQAEAVSQDFARAYVHQEMVGLDGSKMSKSKGNLVLVSRLRAEGIDPMAIRLLLLAHRYDVPWDFTRADLAGADFTGADLLYSNPEESESYNRFKTFSQEFRLTGSTDKVDWLVGMFYANEDLDKTESYRIGAGYEPYLSTLVGSSALPQMKAALDPTLAYLSAQYQLPLTMSFNPLNPAIFMSQFSGQTYGTTFAGFGALDKYEQNAKSLALFTNNTWHATEALDVTLGLRYTREKKSLESVYENPNNGLACAASLASPGAGVARLLAARITNLSQLPAAQQAALIGQLTTALASP